LIQQLGEADATSKQALLNDGEVLIKISLRKVDRLGRQFTVHFASDDKRLLSPADWIHVLRVLGNDRGILLDHTKQLTGQLGPEHAYIWNILIKGDSSLSRISMRTGAVDDAVIPHRVQVRLRIEPRDLD